MVGKDLIMATLLGSGGGSSGSGGGGGWPEAPDDGKTRLYITLAEGRTSPMLGVGVNGTVTVDWGDGTEPDVLTGTKASSIQWTPNHAYATPGDYVITLTVDGEMGLRGGTGSDTNTYFLRHASSGSDTRNRAYRTALQRVVIGSGVTSIGMSTFGSCYGLASVTIPESVTSIGSNAFSNCYTLTSAKIPEGVTSIENNVFSYCYGMVFYDFTTHTAVPTLANTSAFSGLPSDCEIRVPAALYDEWIAATNWATYASQIKAY